MEYLLIAILVVLVTMLVLGIVLVAVNTSARKATLRAHLGGYDYKVIDILVYESPDNHTKKINRMAIDGWRVISASLIEGSTEGVQEIRYVMARPWEDNVLDVSAIPGEEQPVLAAEEETSQETA